jgi:plastocyanin
VNRTRLLYTAAFTTFSLLAGMTLQHVTAESVPEWVKSTAKWYGEGKISETEFVNAIKYLIENNIIVLELDQKTKNKTNPTFENIIIPNGNSKVGNVGFYIPLNLEIEKGTTVVWINDDNIEHTVQSQDDKGNLISLFNSGLLRTGERFAHKFNDDGIYHYFCTIHPWRVGIVTVS